MKQRETHGPMALGEREEKAREETLSTVIVLYQSVCSVLYGHSTDKCQILKGSDISLLLDMKMFV